MKEWRLEKQMGFLQPYIVNKSREGNVREDRDDENSTQDYQANVIYTDVDTYSIVEEELTMQQQNESAEYEAQLQVSETLPSTSAATASSTASPKSPTKSETPKSAKKIKKDDVAALLRHTMEKREERAKARTEDRKDMLETWQLTHNDPLFHFFMSMYQSTKRMPPATQHIVKNGVFNVVTNAEATLLNIPAYEQFTPLHQQRETYASTPSHRRNLTPTATPSYSSDSTTAHSHYSDNSLLSPVDVPEEQATNEGTIEGTTDSLNLVNFINTFRT